MADSFDTILTKLGTGRWSLLYLAAMCYWYSLLPYHAIAGAFLAPLVNHTCIPPPHAHTPILLLPPNATTATDNATYSTQVPELENDAACSYVVQDPDTGHLSDHHCTHWNFDNSTFVSTVTSEFQLVCGRRYLRATYQSMYMIGMLVGAAFNGFLADRYGRRTLVAISTTIYSVVAVGSAWLPSLSWILAARFVLGTMHPASLQTGYILVMEILEPRMRDRLGVAQFLTWTLGTMLFSAWAYMVREWRMLQTLVSLPCIFFFPLLWLMGESPRWLAVVGQHERSLRELKRAARWQKVTLPPDQELLAIMKRVQEQAASTSEKVIDNTAKNKLSQIFQRITVLVRTPKIRIVTVVMCIDYFVVAMIFFGLTAGAPTVDIDPFLYVAIAATVELPSSTLFIPLVSFIGRRKMLAMNYFICATVLLLQALIPSHIVWMSVLLVMTGKMMSTSAFNVVFLFSLELIPTEIRTQGMSAAMMSSRAGAIVAPFIMSALDTTYPWAIPVVFGVAAAVAGIAVYPLWETKDTPLLDTVADLEGCTSPGAAKTDANNASNESKDQGPPDKTTPC